MPLPGTGQPTSLLNPLPANWLGRAITTTTNPQQLATRNDKRLAWRAFNISGAAGGLIGYDNNPAHAYIPMPADSSYPIGSDNSAPVESNELWYHGATGAVIGFAEA